MQTISKILGEKQDLIKLTMKWRSALNLTKWGRKSIAGLGTYLHLGNDVCGNRYHWKICHTWKVQTDKLRLQMGRKSLEGIYLWISLQNVSSSKIQGCQEGGSRLGQRLTEWGSFWRSVLLLRFHLKYNQICMALHGRDRSPLSICRIQSAPSNPRWMSGVS